MLTKGQDVRHEDGAVMTCTAADCSYNRELECWAPAVKVGAEHPTCDTFTHLSVEPAVQESKVLACGEGNCDFNQETHCMARGITVTNHTGHADCLTYRP